jgi:hypothetical protein
VSALSKRAAEVEAELGAAWTRYHVAAQAARFVTGVVVTLLWSLHSGLTDWTDLVPLLGTAALVTAKQMWPQVPWTLLVDRWRTGKPPVPNAGGVGG